jgi:excisionase family DNA binding protein
MKREGKIKMVIEPLDTQNYPKLLTLDEVSAVLRCTRETAASLIKSKRLKAVRLGMLYRIPETALLSLLETTETDE